MKRATDQQILIHFRVVGNNDKIADVSKRFGFSPATVRKYLDIVSEEILATRGTIKMLQENIERTRERLRTGLLKGNYSPMEEGCEEIHIEALSREVDLLYRRIRVLNGEH